MILLLFSSMSVSYGAQVRVELEQMWEEADSAVHGKVIKMTKFRDTHFFYTNVEIEVIDFYIRDLDRESVNVTVYGGIPSVEGLGTEDQPWFYMGEEVFVFLEVSDLDNDQIDYFVFGAVQGKYTVEGDRATGMKEPFTLPNPDDTMSERERIRDVASIAEDAVETVGTAPPIDEIQQYTGIEFQLTLIVALGVVVLSIFSVWLLAPN